MGDVDKALATQLANIEKRTGKSLTQLSDMVRKSKLEKHGELVTMLKETLGIGHGDANTLVHMSKGNIPSMKPASETPSPGEVVDSLYAGPKAALRPIHDKLMQAIKKFGDFEESPKKTYVSLRRKKQFATIGPATNSRVEVGLNMKGVKGNERLLELPAGQMCQYKVKVSDAKEVDAALIAWLKTAYDSSG